jgi:L-lactate dehydrogenase
VCVLAFAPAKLAGDNAFRRQTNWLAETCLSQAGIDPSRPIRLPGQLALERKRDALRDGLVLPDIVFRRLRELAERKGVPLPV